MLLRHELHFKNTYVRWWCVGLVPFSWAYMLAARETRVIQFSANVMWNSYVVVTLVEDISASIKTITFTIRCVVSHVNRGELNKFHHTSSFCVLAPFYLVVSQLTVLLILCVRLILFHHPATPFHVVINGPVLVLVFVFVNITYRITVIYKIVNIKDN